MKGTATLRVGEQTLSDLPCTLLVPDDPSWGGLRAYVEVDVKTALRARDWFECTIAFSSHYVNTDAAVGHFYGMRSRGQRHFLEIRPEHLTLIQTLQINAELPLSVTYHIGPNALVEPRTTLLPNLDGSVEAHQQDPVTYELRPGISITFARLYKSSYHKGALIQEPALVAMVEGLDSSLSGAEWAHTLFPHLDTLLRLVWLASGAYAACPGWTATEGVSLTTYFKRDIAIPRAQHDPHFTRGIIDLLDVEEFLRATYNSWSRTSRSEPLAHAIGTIFPNVKSFLEERFTTLFAALEALVLDHRRSAGLEYILKPTPWKTLKDALRKTIKGSDVEKHNRDLLYRKLDEVNRVPLEAAFEAFCVQCPTLVVDDLWPVFGKSEGAGLVDVRNFLVHGEGLPTMLRGPLATATENLRILLLRVVLAMLGWDQNRSEVSAHALQLSPVIRGVDQARAAVRQAAVKRRADEEATARKTGLRTGGP